MTKLNKKKNPYLLYLENYMPVIIDWKTNKNSSRLEQKKLNFNGDTKLNRFARNMRTKQK